MSNELDDLARVLQSLGLADVDSGSAYKEYDELMGKLTPEGFDDIANSSADEENQIEGAVGFAIGVVAVDLPSFEGLAGITFNPGGEPVGRFLYDLEGAKRLRDRLTNLIESVENKEN